MVQAILRINLRMQLIYMDGATMLENVKLVTPGHLVVATEGDIPPYSSKGSHGKLDGLEVRLMGEVAKRLNLVYQPLIVSWSEIISGLNSDLFDVSSAPMDITLERLDQLDFSNPWVDSGAQLVALTENQYTDEELKVMGCSMLQNSTWEKMAKDHFNSLMPCETNVLALDALVNKKVGCMLTDLLAAEHFITTLKLPLRKVGGPLNRSLKGWAVKKNNHALLLALNSTFQSIIEDGTYQKISQELVGYSILPTNL